MKHILLIILLNVLLLLTFFTYAEETFWVDNQQVSEDQFNAAIMEMYGDPVSKQNYFASHSHSGLSLPDLYNGNQTAPSTATQPSATASDTTTANNTNKKQPAPKITVYFSDLYGHVIGSSQVTSGTGIADSQFPKTVEDVDGHIFDKWDYDGRVLYHDFIVRAEYK